MTFATEFICGAVYLTPRDIINGDIQAKLGLEEGSILFDDE